MSQGLMRDLELREKKVNEIQATGEKLLKEGHPGRKTVEVGDRAPPCGTGRERPAAIRLQ